MILPLVMAGFLAFSPAALQQARDRQDRAALDKMVDETSAQAAKAPGDAEAQYRLALAASYSAEVYLEQHEKKLARAVAERGIKAADKAVALKPDRADYYRVLATLCGQAITDLMSGLSYGPRSKNAIEKAMSLAPNSSANYVARGVGEYYLPPQLGGGNASALADFHKAIDLDPKNSEAYLWLGLCLRKDNKDAEARQAFSKALELDPDRVWIRQQLEKTPSK